MWVVYVGAYLAVGLILTSGIVLFDDNTDIDDNDDLIMLGLISALWPIGAVVLMNMASWWLTREFKKKWEENRGLRERRRMQRSAR